MCVTGQFNFNGFNNELTVWNYNLGNNYKAICISLKELQTSVVNLLNQQ